MKKMKELLGRSSLLVCLFLLTASAASAQSSTAGGTGLENASTMVRGYFQNGSNLLYAAGGLMALIGAGKAYQKWNMGEPNVWTHVSSWFGSCIFLVMSATLIKAFFAI